MTDEATPEMVITGYTTGEPGNGDPRARLPMIGLMPGAHRPECTIFGHKYVEGNTPCDGVLPLDLALTEEWPTDAHFAMYVSTAGVRCVKSCSQSYDLRFDFLAIDLDFQGHKGVPAEDDFARLIRLGFLLDHTPNLAYATRGGARFIYYIEPAVDADWFEQRYAAFLAVLDEPFTNARNGYKVDCQCKDWTRLFRFPKVVRDGEAEYDRAIRCYHTRLLNLDGFKVKEKREYKPRGNGQCRYDGTDLKLLRWLRSDLTAGNRNQTGFKAFCHCYREYSGADLERALDTVHDALANAGLDEQETTNIKQSASKQETK